MPATISYPSDAVANGATVIQTSAFNVSAADYNIISFQQASAILKTRGKVKGFPTATNDQWVLFYHRKDLAAASAHLANVIGVRIVPGSTGVQLYNASTNSYRQVVLRYWSVMITNWHVVQVTLSDGSIVTKPSAATVEFDVFENPETGARYTENDAYNTVMEALGLGFTQTAATFPVMDSALKLAAGVSSL